MRHRRADQRGLGMLELAVGGVLIAAVVAGAAVLKGMVDEAKTETQTCQREHAEAVTAATSATLAAEQTQRTTERTWETAARSVDRDWTIKAERLAAQRTQLAAANGLLNDRLDAAAALARGAGQASAAPAAAADCQATAQAFGVLTELHRGAVARAGVRAGYADAAAAAAAACERFDAVTR